MVVITRPVPLGGSGSNGTHWHVWKVLLEGAKISKARPEIMTPRADAVCLWATAFSITHHITVAPHNTHLVNGEQRKQAVAIEPMQLVLEEVRRDHLLLCMRTAQQMV